MITQKKRLERRGREGALKTKSHKIYVINQYLCKMKPQDFGLLEWRGEWRRGRNWGEVLLRLIGFFSCFVILELVSRTLFLNLHLWGKIFSFITLCMRKTVLLIIKFQWFKIKARRVLLKNHIMKYLLPNVLPWIE